MSKHLQNYFDAAKQQAPLLTEKEVTNLLNAAPKVVVKKRFFNLKRFVFMSTLSVMITAIWLMWNNQNVSTIKPQATISLKQVAPTQPQPNNTNGLIEKPVLNRLQLSPTKPQQVTPDSLNKPQEPNKITSWFEPKNSNSYIEPQEPTREYFNENGELMLTHEELAKLGIITDGNVLSYNNVVDTIIQVTIKENNKPTEKGLFNFTLKITKSGGIHTTQGGAIPLSKLPSNNLPFWCSFIEIKSSKDSSINVAEHFDHRTNSVEDFVQEIKRFCIPVYVQTKAELAGKYRTDNETIFWFKAEQAFIEALPLGAKQLLQARVDTTNISEYRRILNSYSNIKKVQELKSILGDTLIAELQKRIIKLDYAGLKLLNINQKKSSFTYRCVIRDDNSARRIRLKYEQGISSYTKTIELNSIKLRDTLTRPIALTTKTIDLRRYFYINNEELASSKTEQKNHERFAKECNELIPIQVTSNMVLWFRPTNYLMDVMSNHQISDNFKLEKSRLVRLTENELTKLNITYTSEGIGFQTYVGKTSSIYSVYNNYESNHSLTGFKPIDTGKKINFQADTMVVENDTALIHTSKPKVPTPVLITTLDGIGWRAYEYDIDKFIDPKEVAYMKEHNLSPINHPPYLEAKEKAKQALINELNTMLPIAIVHPTLKNTGVIAWYRTDSTLLNLLPAELALDIKREASAIINNQESYTCKYFETCNPASVLYEVTAFPNPIENKLNIEIDCSESRNYTMILTDIEGKVIKTLTKNKVLQLGKHQLPFEMADLAPGMYLLQVNTQYNELKVKRIIKK
jgi:hypothetical protein